MSIVTAQLTAYAFLFEYSIIPKLLFDVVSVVVNKILCCYEYHERYFARAVIPHSHF